MFVQAIEIVKNFTRPFQSISRAYGQTRVDPSCASLIVVNEEGWVLTCRHVAEEIRIAEEVNKQYSQFKAEVAAIPKRDGHYRSKVKELEKKYGYDNKKLIRVQQKNHLSNIVDKSTKIEFFAHPDYDIALIHISGFNHVLCDEFPVFAKDSSELKQGMSLCRLGFPYPEFTNFRYNDDADDIEWTDEGNAATPFFPIEGILTRFGADESRKVYEIELSTPGLKGQSGCPLFDRNGIVYGIQSRTITLPLGFDMEDKELIVNGIKKKINDYSFIHLGRCVHIDVIKKFMDDHGVKYRTE